MLPIDATILRYSGGRELWFSRRRAEMLDDSVLRFRERREALELLRPLSANRVVVATLRHLLARDMATASLVHVSDTAVLDQLADRLVMGALVARIVIPPPLGVPRGGAYFQEEARQAGKPRLALAHNSGGWVDGQPAATNVHVLERADAWD